MRGFKYRRWLIYALLGDVIESSNDVLFGPQSLEHGCVVHVQNRDRPSILLHPPFAPFRVDVHRLQFKLSLFTNFCQLRLGCIAEGTPSPGEQRQSNQLLSNHISVTPTMPHTTLHYAHSSPLQSIDFFPAKSSSPLLVYVHGGAWRSGDNQNLHPFASRLVKNHNIPVALVNYRLTTPATHDIVHPLHAHDVLDALNFILSHPSLEFDHSSIHLAGHSCGAHILSSIYLNSPSLSPPMPLLSSVKSISLSEGLYDLDLLLSTWPSYSSFVLPAFGHDLTKFHTLSPSNFPLREESIHIRWFIIHSTGDLLVDLPQSSTMYQHLLNLGASVTSDWTSLHGNHDEILTTEDYPNMIAHHIFSSQD